MTKYKSEATRIKDRGRAKRWEKDNPEKAAANAKAWRAKNPRKAKNNSYMSLYGITLEEAEVILSRKCGICGTLEGKLHIDHDHTTGKVRDCLCHHCNTGLGLFKDSPELLNKAIEYLKTHKEGTDLCPTK